MHVEDLQKSLILIVLSYRSKYRPPLDKIITQQDIEVVQVSAPNPDEFEMISTEEAEYTEKIMQMDSGNIRAALSSVIQHATQSNKTREPLLLFILESILSLGIYKEISPICLTDEDNHQMEKMLNQLLTNLHHLCFTLEKSKITRISLSDSISFEIKGLVRSNSTLCALIIEHLFRPLNIEKDLNETQIPEISNTFLRTIVLKDPLKTPIAKSIFDNQQNVETTDPHHKIFVSTSKIPANKHVLPRINFFLSMQHLSERLQKIVDFALDDDEVSINSEI